MPIQSSMPFRTLLTLLAIVLAAAGCGRPSLAPSPNLFVLSDGDPFADVVPAYRNNRVDILYATADMEVDRQQGLHSIPARFGLVAALNTSRAAHLIAVVLLAEAGRSLGTSPWFFAGVAVAAVLLAYEQSLVKANDLSKLNMAFFTMNGVIAVVFGALVVIGEVV